MTIPSTDKPSNKLTSLVGLLDHAVRIVPAARYFWGVVAASVTVAIITMLNGLRWLTVVAIVAATVLMFIFYIFSRIEKSSDTVVKLLGYCLLIVTTLAFMFVIVTSAWFALSCTPRVLAYLYGVSEVCYGSRPVPPTPGPSATAPPATTSPAVISPVQSQPPPQPTDSNPIKWDFPTGTTSRDADLLFNAPRGGGGYWVSAYCLQGVNVSDDAITGIGAFVMPLNTGEKLTLKSSDNCGDISKEVSLNRIAAIEPKARIFLVYDMKIPRDGRILSALSIDEYLKNYGGFKFHFYSDNKNSSLTREFTYSDIKSMLTAGQKENDERNKPAPRVILKN